ncbi:hypothetical protein EJB05_26667, partial [Eragrostis curvula]
MATSSTPAPTHEDRQQDPLHLVLRRLSSNADRLRFASVCRHWRHVAQQFSSPCSSLPPELACLVLRRMMRSHADRVRFAAVCRHWRYVARQYSLPLPWLCSSYGLCQSLPDGKIHFLRSKEQCYGSFGNWLLYKEISGDRRSLKNPLTGATMSLPTHCKKPVYLYMDGSLGTPSDETSNRFDINKVIVCTGNLIVALVSYRYSSSKEVVCCRPGMPSWSMGLRHGYRNYMDMAVHKGNIYAVDKGGDLFVHEVNEDSDFK